MLLTNDHVYNNILQWSRMARYFGMSGCSNRATYVSPRPSEVPTSRGERRPVGWEIPQSHLRPDGAK